MADKIKAIKIKQKNGTYSEEVPISVNVQNVQWDENNHTLLDALGSVDISSSGKGNLQHQIDELDGDKISTNEFNSRLNDFLKDQISADTTDWLDDNVNPVGSAVIVDKTLTIDGAAADALAVKTELNKKANVLNTYTKAEVDAAIDAKQIEVDDTLSITGTAADAKAVGDELTAIKADLGALIAPPRLDNNTDLDSVITPGVYTLYANSAYTNKPTQDAEHGILEMWHEKYGDNAGRFFQRLTYTYKAGRTNSEIWVRSKSAAAGAAWTPWISVSNMSINDAENLLQEKIGLISKIEGSYINLTTDPVSLTPVSNVLWAHSIVACSEGDKFIINSDGGQSPRAWGFLDSANHVLSVCGASTVVEDLELTAPANAAKLIINDRSGEISYIVGNNLVSKIRDGHISPSTPDNGELTDNVKNALLRCFRNVAWIDQHGQTYYNDLKKALYLATYPGIVATFDSGTNNIQSSDSLDSLKEYLAVTYYTSANDDGTLIQPNDYILSGELSVGRNTITVDYSGVQTTFSVDVFEPTQTITFAPKYNFTNNNNATPNIFAQYNNTGRQGFAATGSSLPKFKQAPNGTDTGTITAVSPYSAIKFPTGKTSVIITCPNARCNINWYSLSSNGYYDLESISGWQAANSSFRFTKSTYEYFVIIFDSSDSDASNYSLRFE